MSTTFRDPSPATGHPIVPDARPEDESPVGSPLRAPKAVRSPWERLGRFLFVFALVAAFPVAMYRAFYETGGTDFPEFYAAGRHILEYGDTEPTRFLKYYWPSLDVAWAGLAWMPAPLAAAVWYGLCCGSWIGLLAAINRYLLAHIEQPQRRLSILAAGLLMTPLVLDHVCLGAFHLFMVWWMVAGLGRASQGKDWSGGAVLGLAVWIKLLPLLGVAYLVLKRKWRAAAVAVGCAVVVDILLAVPALGLGRTWELHQQWWKDQATGTNHRTFTHPDAIDEDRLTNQSLAIIMRRLLTDMGLESGEARGEAMLAHLSADQLRRAYYGIVALIGLAGLAYCRRPGRTTSESQWATEIALLVLSTLWLSPVAWSYHATAATPALAVVMGRNPQYPRLGWATVVLWLAAMALMGWPLARAYGELLWATVLLGLILLWPSLRTARPPQPACQLFLGKL